MTSLIAEGGNRAIASRVAEGGNRAIASRIAEGGNRTTASRIAASLYHDLGHLAIEIMVGRA